MDQEYDVNAFINDIPDGVLTDTARLADDGLPYIDITDSELRTLADECWNAIKEGNRPPVLFKYGNDVVRVSFDENGQAYLQAATIDILRHELARWAVWVKRVKGQWRSAFPPRDVMADLLAARNMPLPRLTRIVDVPVFGPDGSLMLVPGHDPASGVLYVPARDFEALPVPETVTWDDVMQARELIENELLIDFPFASASDMHNAIGLFILPFVRDMIDGPTPCHLVDAPMPASGKGLLVQALLYAGVGKSVGVTTQPRDDDEWRKKLTTVLAEGRPAVLFDNMSRVVDSGALAAAFTGDVWSDRILGRNETTQIKIRAIWTMTGNNVTFSTEIGRRLVRTRLAPQTDHPEDREGWRHPDLLEWVHNHRPQLVRAAHILVKYWLQQGRPAPSCRLLGSFERWTKVVGGILNCAGYDQFLGNYKEFIDGSDTERQARAMLCVTWYEFLFDQNGNSKRKDDDGKPMTECSTTFLLKEIASRIDGLEINGFTERAQVSSLGRYLKANEEVVTSYTEEVSEGEFVTTSYKIIRKRIKKGVQMWGIERL